MLATYQAGTDVTIQVTVPSSGGAQLASANSVSYAVFDEAGVEVKAEAALAGYTNGDTSVSVTVGASDSALASGVIRGVRRVDVYFDTDEGRFTATGRFVIETLSKLVVATNSFCTLDQAHLERVEMLDLNGWDTATEAEIVAALASAYLRLCKLTYRYPLNDGQNYLQWSDDRGVLHNTVQNIRDMTVADFEATPASFRKALRRAQIQEANSILDGDPFQSRRDQGVISETIGESKVFMQPIPAVRTPVCRAAMDELRGFLYRAVSVGRA